MTTRRHPQRAPPSDAFTSDPPCFQICARSLFLLWSSVEPPGIFCHQCWSVMKGCHIQITMLKVKQWETWILYFTQLSGHICCCPFCLTEKAHCNRCNRCIIQTANKQSLLFCQENMLALHFYLHLHLYAGPAFICSLWLKCFWICFDYGVPGSATKYKNDEADNKPKYLAPVLIVLLLVFDRHSHFSVIFQDYSGLKLKHAHASINCIWLYILCSVYMLTGSAMKFQRFKFELRISTSERVHSKNLSVFDIAQCLISLQVSFSVTWTLVKFCKCDRNRWSGSN